MVTAAGRARRAISAAMGGSDFAPVNRGRHAEQALCPSASRLAYLMIHQFGDRPTWPWTRRITGCPEWHNPAMFIVWIEENTSLTPGHR
jgi:hypothetical protein